MWAEGLHSLLELGESGLGVRAGDLTDAVEAGVLADEQRYPGPVFDQRDRDIQGTDLSQDHRIHRSLQVLIREWVMTGRTRQVLRARHDAGDVRCARPALHT